MREYSAPMITDIADIAEGVYAASGMPTPTPTPIPTPTPTPGIPIVDYNYTFNGQDGGGFSEVRFLLQFDRKSYKRITVSARFYPGDKHNVISEYFEFGSNGVASVTNSYVDFSTNTINFDVTYTGQNDRDSVEVWYKMKFNHDVCDDLGNPEKFTCGSYNGATNEGTGGRLIANGAALNGNYADVSVTGYPC